MVKQVYRKDFCLFSNFFSLKNENLVIRDIAFSYSSNNFYCLKVSFLIDHFFYVQKKYNINLSEELFFPIIIDFVLNCKDFLNYISLNKELSVFCSHYIEKNPIYSKLGSSFLIESVLCEAINTCDDTSCYFTKRAYQEFFKTSILEGVQEKLFSPDLLLFDLEYLSKQLDTRRDLLFDYIGISTLYRRFFAKYKDSKKTYEVPQGYWMRIAMGLAINEKNRDEKAVEFYNVLSKLLYIPSTPTLCHSGFVIPQLASCYLTVVQDDLQEIFDSYGHTAQLAKWSGGIATSWNNIRACGAHIKKINLDSQGVIPYLKIEDDIISSISKTGTRRGGKAVYLETWHYDIEEFLDLKKNTGDHRRRTHDLNTAVWISDLFMKRVYENKEWTLFSPDEVDLTSVYGKAFFDAYCKYEKMADNGHIKLYKKILAKDLWKKILIRLFETGHPWITFKDPSNIRSPQKHAGVVNSSNLCTEITLNTSKDEIAVCNLGSLNLKAHYNSSSDDINFSELKKTIKIAMRMLDNVIDLTYYPVEIAKNSNMRHRPVGLGVMGWQDLLCLKKYSFESKETEDLVNQVSEFISYNAIEGSVELAAERGAYSSYQGSLWSQGYFPHKTISLLEKERGLKIDISEITELCDWQGLLKKMKMHGMRNSNTQAIAPTATISTIAGTFPSIEPIYKNMYVKSNITGEFTIINNYLVDELKGCGLWSEKIAEKIKYYDGSILMIEEISDDIKKRYKTAFEIDQKVLIHLTAIRACWIDQSQSHNVFFRGTSGKELDEIYKTAWEKGLKTTYYCRSLGKSQIEKSTLGTKYGFTQKRDAYDVNTENTCQISNEEGCESCQ